MAWFKKKPKKSTRANTATVETKEAEIKRRAAELQMLAEKGVPTGEAVTALAAALGNEIAVLVMRNPSLTTDEIAEPVCQSVRDMARCSVSSSPAVPDRLARKVS
jgi:hypothetical protein